ncbi:MAG: hypothetical protein PHY64_10925 [Eubacteriales bacterium]|nr:hypothetical protein [Eubacteriales bacterium]
MTFDAVQLHRDLRRRDGRQPFDLFRWTSLAALVAFSLYIFLWEFANTQSDLYKHAIIASEFNFADLHSITSRLAYPLWHIFVSALYQLGVPLNWSAAIVCAVCKGLLYLLVCRYLTVMTRSGLSRAAVALISLGLMLVTPIRIAGVNPLVYKGIGSPTVWHNPTQLAVLVTAMLCVPYTVHCWYVFEQRLPSEGNRAMLPWRKVIMLAALTMVSLACKPTFMQALIPAAAVFFLVQWIRHPRNSRYFLQIILAFIPSVAYFLLQYLYYTGVVVPYTSGVYFGATLADAWFCLRSLLMMTAFPLFVLVVTYRKGMFKDATLVLCLLMAVFGMLQATFFHETGVRLNHGNFNWASLSAAFMLWVVVTPRFFDSIAQYRADRLRLQASAKEGAVSSGVYRKASTVLHVRSAAYLASFILLVWHLYSSIYYLYFLLSSGNTF